MPFQTLEMLFMDQVLLEFNQQTNVNKDSPESAFKEIKFFFPHFEVPPQ
jgi:hypothetical protein